VGLSPSDRPNPMTDTITGPDEAMQRLHDIIGGNSRQPVSAILEKFNEVFLKMTQTEGEGNLIAYTVELKESQERYEIRIHRDDALKLFYMMFRVRNYMTVEKNKMNQQHQESLASMQEKLEFLKEQRDHYRSQANIANDEIRHIEKRITQQQQKERVCEICGKSLNGKKANAETCSVKCRKAKERRDKEDDEKK